MALGRGERIGEAYIRIHADGSGLNREIRDQFRDSEGEFSDAGARGSKAYNKAFAEQNSSNVNQKLIRESFGKTLAKGDWLETTFFKGRNWREFRNGTARNFGSAGRLAVHNFEKELSSGKLGFDELAEQMEDLRPALDKAYAEIDKDREAAYREHAARLKVQQRKMLDEAYDLNRTYDARALKAQREFAHDELLIQQGRDRRFQADLDRHADALEDALRAEKRMHTEAYQENAERNRRNKRLWDDMDADFDKHVRDTQEGYDRIVVAMGRMEKGEKTGAGSRRILIRDLGRMRDNMTDVGEATTEHVDRLRDQDRTLRLMSPRLNRYHAGINRIADASGRAFGRGSRNNFINFIGAMVRGSVRLLGVIPSIVGWFMRIGRSARIAFDESMRLTGSSMRAGLAGLIAGLESGGAAFALFAVAAVGAMVFIGPLVAIMSLLTGVVTALASTLAFALVAAVGSLVAVLLPLGAALAVGVAGVLSMDDASKKLLKLRLKPLVSEFRALGRAASRGMFKDVGEQASALAPIFEGLRGTFRQIGEAISDVATGWIEMMSGSAFGRFRDAMEKFLPDAIRSLGTSIGSLFGGLGGLFRGMIPFLERTLAWLERITGKFNEWANSKSGQDSIIKFFKDAGDSAKSVGDFLGAINGLLAELFSAGRGTGDSIFDSMTAKLEEWTTWLEKNPDAVNQWFSDAEDLAGEIGEVILKIGELIDTLDNAATRIGGSIIFQAIAANIEAVDLVLQGVSDTFSTIKDTISNIGDGFDTFSTDMDQTVEDVRNFVERVALEFVFLPLTIAAAMTRIPGIVGRQLGKLPGLALRSVLAMGVFFATLPARAVTAVLTLPLKVGAVIDRLPGLVGSTIGRVIGLFGGLPRRADTASSSLPSKFDELMSKLPPSAREDIDTIVEAFRGMPGRIDVVLNPLANLIGEHFAKMVTNVADIPGQIVDLFAGLAGRIIGAIGTITIPRPTLSGGGVPFIPGVATGGLFNGAQLRWIGEDGPEAVIPLNRNLALVDPAVRWLSAIAQGKAPGMASGGVVGGGRTVNVGGITVNTPNSDPRAVAVETINRLVAVGGY